MNVKFLVDKGLEFIISVSIIFMVVAVCWQVFTRYVLGMPSTVTEEMLRYTLIWTTMVGSSYAYGKNKHLSIVVLVKKLTDKNKIYLDILIQLIVITTFSMVFLYGGNKIVAIAKDQVSPALEIPMQFVYKSLLFCGIFTIYYAINFLIEDIKKLKKGGV